MNVRNNDANIFHVHTYRCGHAGQDPDELYVRKAIELGASAITFTDHAPFPGNPFGNRMKIEQLPEYVQSLCRLREQYRDVIEVRIGLEIEYLPRFRSYYEALKESDCFDILMLGQHFYECAHGTYNFSLSKELLRASEAEGICRAVIAGMETGLFQVLAHPDRMFRYCGKWNEDMEQMSKEIVKTAVQQHVILEQNLSSMKRANYYRDEFWNLVPDTVQTIIGTDAHAAHQLDDVGMYVGMEARKIC